MCAATAYLPLSFMPLFLAAFCIYAACRRAGIAYGVICAACSIGLMFLMSGLSIKWIAFIMIFAPYGLLCALIDRVSYFGKIKYAVIRFFIVLVYFNLMFGFVYMIATQIASVVLDGMDVQHWAAMVGGYAVLAVIMSVIMMPLDFIFCGLSVVVLKKIPAIRSKRDKKNVPPPQKNDEVSGDGKKYDIFGYEILDKDTQSNEPAPPEQSGDDPDEK